MTLDCLIGNILYDNILTYLYCKSKDAHLVGIYDISDLGMCQCLLLDRVKILDYFYTDYLHGRHAGKCLFLNIFWWLDREKVILLRHFIIPQATTSLYSPHTATRNISYVVVYNCIQKPLHPLTVLPVLHHFQDTIGTVIIGLVVITVYQI